MRRMWLAMTLVVLGCGDTGGVDSNPTTDAGVTLQAPEQLSVGQPTLVEATLNNGGPALLSGPNLRLEAVGNVELLPTPVGSQASVQTGADFITWTDFFVGAGFSRTFTFEVTPLSAGSVTLNLRYDSELSDPNSGNDSFSLTLQTTGG